MKKYIGILFLLLAISIHSQSQVPDGCDVSEFGSVLGDNALEIKLVSSLLDKDGKTYYVCEFHVKRLGDWYNGTTKPAKPKDITKYLSGLTLSSDFTFDKFALTAHVTSSVPVSLPITWEEAEYEGVMYPMDEIETTSCNYINGATSTTVDRWFELSLTLGDSYSLFPDLNTYWHMCTLELEVLSGVSGNVGLMPRDTKVKLHPSGASNKKLGVMGICFTGNGIQTIGGGEKPVLAEITGDSKICQGVGGTYTTSFTAGGDGATVKWAVKKEGADVTADVVQGGAITSTTTSATFTWANDVPAGNYMISAIPTNGAGAGDEKLLAVEVFVPTVTIDGNTSGCAGEALALQANPGSMQSYQWYTKNGNSYTAVSGATSSTFSPTLPTLGTEVTYKVEAKATTAQGGCSASKEREITINPVPTLLIETEIAGGKRPINSTKYALGDKIVVSVLNSETSTYDYSWLEGSNPKQGTEYIISNATADSYTIQLTVSPKGGGGCGKDTTITLTKDGSLCAPTLALSGTGGNKICSGVGAVCRLKAEVTNLCPDNSVLMYEWYQGATKLASQNAPGEMEAYYVATAAGTYTVRLYTTFGMVSKDVTITSNSTLAETLQVPANTPCGPGETVILAAQCNNVTKWLWELKDNISGSNELQYVTTQPLTENTDFKVYAEQTNGCVSMGKTTVVIGANALHVDLEPAALALCKDGSGTLKAKVTGGTAPYTFTWPTTHLASSKDSIANYKHSGVVSDNTGYLTVVDGNGSSVNVKVEITVAAAAEPKLELTGGDICEGEALTVTQKAENPTNYNWYIRDNAAVNPVIEEKTKQGATLKMDKRGDYTVWVAGNASSVCLSDTAKTKANVKVNGFDPVWDPEPTDYKLGGDIYAGVRIDNATSTSYTFNWDALKNGQQTTAAGVNPSKYQVIAASEDSYHFKAEASVKISDSKSCSKTLEKTVSTLSGGLLLTVADKTVTQCTNGAVEITASAQGGTGAYTFTWYKAGDAANELRKQVHAGGVDNTDIFVQGGFSNGDKVVVQVTDVSSPVLTRRDTIVVNTSAANAPSANAGAGMTIKSGSTTVLFGEVTSGSAQSWHWSPDNWLATGESTKQYPTTKALTAQQDYTLYVIGDNNCVSLPDMVTVNVTTADGFTVDIDEPGVLCIGNTTKLSAKTTPVKNGITWEWYETTGQLTNGNVEKPDFAATETTTVFVKATVGGVTATNSKKITVKNDKAPTLEIQGFIAGTTNICEGSELKVVDTHTPTIALAEATWYIEGVKQQGNSLTYKPVLVDNNPAYQNIKVEAKSNAGCPCVAVAEEDVKINPQPKLEWDASSSGSLALNASPVQVTAKLKSGTQANYTYSWTHEHHQGSSSYSDGGTTPGTATSATSTVTGLTNGAQEGDVYCFGVQVTDGNSCKSELIHREAMIDGDALIIKLEPKYADGYCDGGVAILVATVNALTQPTGVTYTWLKNETPIEVSDANYIFNGNELVVKTPLESDVYKVKVSADGGKSGQSTGVSLTKNTSYSSITLTGVDLMIPTGTRTALMAEPSTSIKEWQWGPTDKLAANESTLKNPYTLNLSASQEYTVYGVDEHKCITLPAKVQVSVISKPAPDDAPNKELFAVIEPDSKTICATNKLQLQTKVWGNVGGTMTYTWNKTDNLDMTPGVAKPIFSSSVDGTYSYAVTVGNGTLKAIARTEIEVVTGMLPEIILDESKTGLACAGSAVVVKVQNGVPVNKYTWVIDGVVDPAVTGNTYTWPSVENPTQVKVQVIAETAGSCMSNVVALDSVVKPALKLDDLQVVDSCGQVILFSNAGKDAQYTWSLTAGDTQLQKLEGASADTLYLKQKTNFTAASVPYTVALKVKPKGGGCESSGNKTGKVYFQPKVVLDKWTYEGEALSYTVRAKGVDVPVSIDNDHSNFGVGNSTLNWKSYAGVALTTGSEQAIVYNIQKEDTIVAIVTNKKAPGCVSRDSMPVYLYPDAPEVDIDTNTNRNTIKLTWKSIPADSVRVWGILDDAYNVEGNDYKRLASVKAINKQWIETNMGDRLKFYYLQSVRKIDNKSFASQVVSDTVGWLKQTLYGKNIFNTSMDAANMFAYPFDMMGKGIKTNRDFVNKILSPALMQRGVSIGEWDFVGQQWKLDAYVDMLGDGSWVDWVGDNKFDLTSGSVYRISFANSLVNSTDLLLYGKLVSWRYDFRVNPNGSSLNLVLDPLSMIDKQKRQALGTAIPATTVGIWDFSKQEFASANFMDFGLWQDWSPVEASDTILLLPLQPVSIIVGSELLNWKK